ncbi:hypothetical protein L218DRAFT_953864, partial [Marasmius fiardii PR-910]
MTSLDYLKHSSASLRMEADPGLESSDPFILWLLNAPQVNTTVGGVAADWSQSSGSSPSFVELGGNPEVDLDLFSEDFLSSITNDPNAPDFNFTDDLLSLHPNDVPGPHDGLPMPLREKQELQMTPVLSSPTASFPPGRSPGAHPHVVSRVQETAVDPIAELTRRVLQHSGITLAVLADSTRNSTDHFDSTASPAPVPVLESHSQLNVNTWQASSSRSYPFSSPSTSASASTSPPSSRSAQASNASDTSLSTTKSAHQGSTSTATIERRYRTTLVTQFNHLRSTVPALRVLDKRGCSDERGSKKGKNCTLGKVVYGTYVKRNEDGVEAVDYIDERGFVDGVKVPRKYSKISTLGKAAEYICVLKKREMRLKREQDGLKQLMRQLVGGSVLLQEWERMWKAEFGGEEKDEVEDEGEDAGTDDEGSEGDDDGEQKRKKPKLLSPPKQEVKEKKLSASRPQTRPSPEGSIMNPKKRGRARSSKVQPNALVPGGQILTFPAPTTNQQAPVQTQPHFSTPTTNQETSFQVQLHSEQPGQYQYFFAVFALFAFYNTPFSSSSHHTIPNHSHTGTVVNYNITSTHPIYRESRAAYDLDHCLIFVSFMFFFSDFTSTKLRLLLSISLVVAFRHLLGM